MSVSLPIALFLTAILFTCSVLPVEADTATSLQQSFIWSPSSPPGKQAYVAFRRVFSLHAAPKQALLHLFADTRYTLWVNGKYVERGPCRFDPKAPEYDTLPITGYLHPGKNALVVLVHHLHDGKVPEDPANYRKIAEMSGLNGRSMRHAPGLTALLEITDESGQSQLLRTAADWRVSTNTRYLPGPLDSWEDLWGCLSDRIDARRDTGDWTLPNFDDSGWEHAMSADGTQWGALTSRVIPRLRETARTPAVLLLKGGKVRLPLRLTAGQELIVDMGQMMLAYDLIGMDADAGSVLEVFHGHGLKNGQPEEGYGVNRYITKAGRQTYMSGDTRGFRYMALRVKEGRITLRSVKAVNRLYPFDTAGKFRSSNAFLNELWERSVRTVRLCSEDGYVDCNARERAEWMGDAALCEFPITQVTLSAAGPDGRTNYGDPRLIRNMLRHIAQSQQPDGRLKAHHPSDRWDIHGYIEDYACLWVQTLRRYYESTEDRILVQELWPALTKQMAWFQERRTESGLVKAREFIFFDNPLAYKECEGTTLNACLVGSLRDAAELAMMLGKSEEAEQYRKEAAELAVAIHRNLWDAESGAYHGGILDGKKTEPTAHAAMLALSYGIVPEEQRAGVTRWLIEHRQKVGTPYTHHYLFRALYQTDTVEMHQLCLQIMRERWASTLARKDVDTVFEGFGNPSLCHNMGAQAAYWLSSYVLGVRRERPLREKHLLIAPCHGTHRGGDLRSAEGIVVTEFGPVPISWKQEKSGWAYQFTVPAGVTATLALLTSVNLTITLDGKRIPAEKVTRVGNRLTVEVGSGTHRARLGLPISSPPR